MKKMNIKLSKKKVLGAIFVLFVIIIMVSPSDGEEPAAVSATNEPVKVDVVEPPQTSESTELADYANKMLLAIDSIQTANANIVKVGQYGEQLDFDSAAIYLGFAKKEYELAKQSIERISPPAEAIQIHNLIRAALDKFIESTDLYKEGLESYEVDLIEEGTVIYKEGTSNLNEASDLMWELNGKQELQ